MTAPKNTKLSNVQQQYQVVDRAHTKHIQALKPKAATESLTARTDLLIAEHPDFGQYLLADACGTISPSHAVELQALRDALDDVLEEVQALRFRSRL